MMTAVEFPGAAFNSEGRSFIRALLRLQGGLAFVLINKAASIYQIKLDATMPVRVIRGAKRPLAMAENHQITQQWRGPAPTGYRKVDAAAVRIHQEASKNPHFGQIQKAALSH